MILKMKDLTINLALGKIFNKYENSSCAEVVVKAIIQGPLGSQRAEECKKKRLSLCLEIS
jgi:hypothetical protein